MAYHDALLTLSGSITGNTVAYQTVTGASAVLSTNTVDLSVARDIGGGSELPKLQVQVGTAFAGLTALTIEAIVADDAALTTNVTVIGSSGAIPVAQLIANSRWQVELNPKIGGTAPTGRRYFGVRYVPTGTGTAGTAFAHLGLDAQDGLKSYASGFSVR